MTTFLKSLVPTRLVDAVRGFSRQERLIRRVKARKLVLSRSPYRYLDEPKLALIVQSFNHRGNIERIVERLRMTAADEIIICEDGSVDGSERIWRRELTRPNEFVLLSNDLHEIRSYNRAAAYSNAEYICFMQDDDIPPPDPRWAADALAMFERDSDLAVLGCWNGWALAFDDPSAPYDVGTPVGSGVAQDMVRPIGHLDEGTGREFAFIDAVGIGPLFVRRSDFISLDGFDLELSAPGAPGIWLDWELCMRAWRAGRRVAVYSSDVFRRNVGGQGTMMFAASTRSENFVKNLSLVRARHESELGSIHETIESLNSDLPDSR